MTQILKTLYRFPSSSNPGTDLSAFFNVPGTADPTLNNVRWQLVAVDFHNISWSGKIAADGSLVPDPLFNTTTFIDPQGYSATMELQVVFGPLVEPPCKSPCESCCDDCCNHGTSGSSSEPVRYVNGEIQLAHADLSINCLGVTWGHTRTYSNQLPDDGNNFGNGNNWLVKQLPTLAASLLVTETSTNASILMVQWDPKNVVWFDGVPDTDAFAARDGAKFKMTWLPDDYTVVSPDGYQWMFHGFSDYPNSPGAFATLTAPGGGGIGAFYSDDGQLTEIRGSDGTTTQSILYTYGTSGGSDGQIASLLLRRGSPDTDTWENVSQVLYTYYDGSDANGSASDLQTVVQQTWNGSEWISAGTTYYRYYIDDASGIGFQHGLKFVILPDSYKRMTAASIDPLTAAEAALAPYADNYFEFDPATHRVTREIVAGGTREFGFQFTSSGFNPGYNNWYTKTVETRPDGSQNIVFTNYLGAVMLKELNSGSAQSSGGNSQACGCQPASLVTGSETRASCGCCSAPPQRWIEHLTYDPTTGYLVSHAEPSAIDMSASPIYDEALPNLAVQRRPFDGLIHLYTYYDTNDPITDGGTGTGSGAAAGYQKAEFLQRGALGTPIAQSLLQYTSQTATYDEFDNTATIYPIARRTVYRDECGSQPIVTSFNYIWPENSLQMSQRTTIFPVVSSDQNGSGTAATLVEVFDTYGNPTWTMDPRGYITKQVFDVLTGTMTQSIRDYDTSQVGSDAPSGWTTPAGGGLNLITDYSFDAQSRPIQTLGPSHTIDLAGTATVVRTASWTVYRDDLDQVWSAQGYATGDGPDYAYTLINPVSISQFDDNGRPTARIAATRGSDVESPGALSAADSFPPSTWVRCSTSAYNDAGQQINLRVFSDLTSTWADWTWDEWVEFTLDQWASSEMTGSPAFSETNFGYDAMNRQNMVRTPGGTITRPVYDVRGKTLQKFVGTNDAGASDADPTGRGAPGNNMLLVDQNQFDHGCDGGNGNLTQTMQFVDANPANARVIRFGYDWRDRKCLDDGEIDFCRVTLYDNLNHAIQTDNYDTTSAGNLIGRAQTLFDDRGQVYRTIRFAVDPATGVIGASLVDDTWRDAAGQEIKSLPAGAQLFTKTVHDGIGRSTASYAGYYTGDGAEPYADCGAVTDDNFILEQSLIAYDAASNVLDVASYQRYHDATGNGALNPPTGSQPLARVSYMANWSDGVGRNVARANYGTNDNADFTRPDVAPASSDTVLVSATVYNARGEAFQSIDPLGKLDEQTFDDANRRVQLVENKTAGTGTDQNRTTQWKYNADNRAIEQTAVNAITGNQTTSYSYGVTTYESALCSNDLLHVETYPDGGQVIHEYNRQRQQIKLTDQNGTVHQFDFDKLGRPTDDRVIAAGPGIDRAVLRIGTQYEVRGMPQTISSYDDSLAGNVVNQVLRQYNTFQQLSAEFQEHGGAVNTAAGSLSVGYGYADGYANTIRPTSITYPPTFVPGDEETAPHTDPGRVLTYGYGVAGQTNDQLSRIGTLTLDATEVAVYTYFGLKSFVQVDYIQAGVRYDLITGSGVNPYAGLDQFGRVIDCLWRKYSATAADLERVQYGYDRASNRTWRQNPVAQAAGKNFDELYAYDGLYQLADLQRGQLNTGHTAINTGTLTWHENWGFDPTGNWQGYKQDDTGAGIWTLDQARTANPVNEITGITNSVGGAWVKPLYDAAGNMTTMPQPASPANGYIGRYDAWNRLVKLADSTTNATVQQSAYDGLNRRIVKTTPDEARHYYFSAAWQTLDERLGDNPGAANPDRQFVWGLRYIDDLILRDRSVSAILDDRLYAMQDANWNVTAICDPIADVQERYAYAGFGTPSVLTSAFAPWSSSYDWETLFSSYRFDVETGLFVIPHRNFLPLVGFWASRDSIGYVGEMNLYRYVLNNPTIYTDPSGMYAWCMGGSVDVGGFISHPSLALKICWDDCANLAAAATLVSAGQINGQETFVPGVLSSFAGFSGQVIGEVALTQHTCVKDMGGIFFEVHFFGGEEVVGQGGIEVTPGFHDVVVGGGIGLGGGAGFPGIPGGVQAQRTYTFMATCTDEKCPCCQPWYDPRQYLGPLAGNLYLPDAAANCGAELGQKLANWLNALL